MPAGSFLLVIADHLPFTPQDTSVLTPAPGINMVGVNTMARINNLGVAAELVGVSLLGR